MMRSPCPFQCSWRTLAAIPPHSMSLSLKNQSHHYKTCIVIRSIAITPFPCRAAAAAIRSAHTQSTLLALLKDLRSTTQCHLSIPLPLVPVSFLPVPDSRLWASSLLFRPSVAISHWTRWIRFIQTSILAYHLLRQLVLHSSPHSMPRVRCTRPSCSHSINCFPTSST